MPPRSYPVLLFLLGCILVARAVILTTSGTLQVWTGWVSAMLGFEFLLLVATMIACVFWYRHPSTAWAGRALRLTVAVVVVHAIRVLVFVMGRTGPWFNWDVRPEYHATHAERWTWFGVWFAASMAFASLIAVVVVWKIRRDRR